MGGSAFLWKKICFGEGKLFHLLQWVSPWYWQNWFQLQLEQGEKFTRDILRLSRKGIDNNPFINLLHEEKGGNMRDWLVEIRKEKQLSQYDAAEKSGISQSYYAAIETGARGNPLKVDVARKIAETLDFNWIKFYEEWNGDWLFCWKWVDCKEGCELAFRH